LPPEIRQLTRVMGVSLERAVTPRLRKAACVRLRCSLLPQTRLETLVSRQQTLDHAAPQKMVNQNIDRIWHWEMIAKLNEQGRRGRSCFQRPPPLPGRWAQIRLGSMTPGPPRWGPRPGAIARPAGGAYEGLCPRLMSGEYP
jgi:hypothetical protein